MSLEREQYRFFDTAPLRETAGIRDRATEKCIREGLEHLFPDDRFPDIRVTLNETGHYCQKASLLERAFGAGKPIEGLPPYVEVEVTHQTGDFQEQLIVWSPLAWNDRFAGTAGGGTGIGGRNYLTAPNNTQRGWTVPMAVINGFTAATMYAGNIEGWHDYTIDAKSGRLNRDLYENWRIRSTHNMTIFGKAIAEILHDRPVRYAYMNGGSGGGRQSLVEAQNYPEDYDGIWASCPAINWHKFLMGGYWAEVVMNEHRHFLSAAKNQHFVETVHQANGGPDAYYHLTEIPPFDASVCIGDRTKDGTMTKEDAAVMNEILAGPRRRDGSFLWYGFRPGVKNWQKIIPIGTYYYPLFGRRVKPFALGPIYLKWITGNPKQRFDQMTLREYETLFDQGLTMFSDNLADDPCIDDFVASGGKLMIDHGIDDPLIPVDGTLDYFEKLFAHFGGQDKLDSFLRLYITPGDNHGNCWGNGPGITERDGMRALMDWVERGITPGEIRKVRVDRKTGKTLEAGTQLPYSRCNTGR